MSERRRLRRRSAALVVGLVVLGAPASAPAAETIYGTTGTNLVRFSSASPGTIELNNPITGLNPAETIAAIDSRPATGELMGLSSSGRLIRLDPRTAEATVVGPGAALGVARYGIDFNPTSDRLRIVSDDEANLRYSPLDGNSIPPGDSPLAPAGNVVSVAYDRNIAGGAKTTLFGLDSTTNRLVQIGGVDSNPSPNLGAVTEIGDVGVNFSPAAGFDIASSDGSAYASLKSGGATPLYAIDLVTGAAGKIGDIGVPFVNDIAVAEPSYSYYATIGGVQSLLVGHSDVPGPLAASQIPLDGLVAGESIVGLDQRPATGELVALTDGGRLYVIDPAAATAVQIGPGPLSPSVGTTLLGFDFNPVADRIRVVGNNGVNLRLDPVTGTIVNTDNPLQGGHFITAAAYTNSYPGATTTVLYDIDPLANELFIQNPPNAGVLTPVGELRSSADSQPYVDLPSVNGFDIAPAGGFGLVLGKDASAPTPGVIRLFRVNLTAGPVGGGRIVEVAASTVGNNPTGFAIMSPGLLSTGPTSAIETGGSAKVAVLRTGGHTGPTTVEYSTADGTATAGSDYTTTTGVVRFADGQAIGVIEVPLLDDSAAEDAETFTVTLSKPSDGAVLGAATSTVSLASDDAAPAPSPTPAPGPAPTATPAPVLLDTTKPLAFIAARTGQTIKTVRSKGLRLQLVAGEPATATITATIDKATAKRLKLKSRTIASGKTTFTAAGVRSVTLKLAAKAKSALKKSRKPVRVSVAATVTDLAGNASKASASVVLPRK